MPSVNQCPQNPLVFDSVLVPDRVRRGVRRRSEFAEQSALIQWARWSARLCRQTQPTQALALDWLHAVPNGLFLGHDARRRTQAGQRAVAAGVADLFLPYALGAVGGLYIEMKAAGGHLTDTQAAFLSDVKMLGFAAVCSFGWEEAAREIIGFLGLQQHAPTPKL